MTIETLILQKGSTFNGLHWELERQNTIDDHGRIHSTEYEVTVYDEHGSIYRDKEYGWSLGSTHDNEMDAWIEIKELVGEQVEVSP